MCVGGGGEMQPDGSFPLPRSFPPSPREPAKKRRRITTNYDHYFSLRLTRVSSPPSLPSPPSTVRLSPHPLTQPSPFPLRTQTPPQLPAEAAARLAASSSGPKFANREKQNQIRTSSFCHAMPSIDRRVTKFGESVFPHHLQHQQHFSDPFEV